MGDPLGAQDGRRFNRRLLLLVDAKGYGASSSIRQREFQETIPRLVEAASHAAALRYPDWETQPQGDALFAVLPEGASEPALVDTFMRALEAGLRNHNESRLAEARLRLRATVHYGPASGGALGFVGPAPVDLARVNGSEALHAALAQAPEAHLAVAVTATVYGDVVRAGHTTLRPAQFRRAEIAEKEFHDTVWIWVPNASGTSDATPGRPATPSADQAPAARPDPAPAMQVTNHNHDFSAPGAVFGIKL